MKNIIICILMLVTVTCVEARKIQGTVTDESGNPLSMVSISIVGTNIEVKTDKKGYFSIKTNEKLLTLKFSFLGYVTQEIKVEKQSTLKVVMKSDLIMTEELYELSDQVVQEISLMPYQQRAKRQYNISPNIRIREPDYEHNTEEYATIYENEFRSATDKPLSTFSIDVDAAAYSNMRRFINGGQLPPKDAVRIEEFINYFSYDYEYPDKDPFSITTEVSQAPWNEDHLIVQIGLQGQKIEMQDLPASNIVFLIDVSGSMNDRNKLPLLKGAFKLLVNELRNQDKVSIVVYAGAAGLVLPSTRGDNKKDMLGALDRLIAGGSTAGGQGIELAYKIAQEQFIKGGNNRVILATDGDFNVGSSDNASMERLITEKRKSGVFLTVLGFGMGNYKDSKMEILANKGNGNYAYIDNMSEAKKVMVNEFGGTLFAIAKDVKIQVEFNPATVQGYRLIGYENRKLADEDFNDDKKDAGELGSGHTVTALYEIIPTGTQTTLIKTIDSLKYQSNKKSGNLAKHGKELMTIKFRYKKPDENTSKLISQVVENKIKAPSENLKWTMAVTSYAMLLQNSKYKGTTTYDMVIDMAKEAIGNDTNGYRAEFIKLVDIAKRISP